MNLNRVKGKETIMKILKNNKTFLLSITILLGLLMFSFYQYYRMYNDDVKRYNETTEKCKLDFSLEICKENKKPIHYDTLTLFFDIFTIESLYWLQLIGCIFVIVPAIWRFHKRHKNGFFKNCLLRENYKEYLKKEFRYAYMASFILPLLALLGFVLCYIVSGFSFDHSPTIECYGKYIPTFNSKYLSMGILFPILYILNLFFHSIFYINLGLISCKKNKNILVAILVTFILFIGMNILCEIVIGGFVFEGMLGIAKASNIFNIFNIWAYSDTTLSWMLLLGFLLAFGSFGMLMMTYRDKEEVIIESEK